MIKTKFPLVSIITVCFNSEKTIIDTLESVLNQSYRNIEYIIIDGNSKDRTVDIIKSYEEEFKKKKIIYEWISEKDNGIYEAMNKGIDKANGEIIGIINSDDWYEKNAIEDIVKKYNQENFDMIYANLKVIKNEKIYIKKAKLRKIISTRYWNHPTTFVKASVYKKNKYEMKTIYDDLDFMLKIRKNKKFKIIILDEIIANFRIGGISTKKSFKQVLKDIKIRNEIYKKNGYTPLYYIDNFIIELVKYILC
ncbi:glycosyltransferase family 2 protein [Fusobacterium ulcerans]|uniref:glycosyltransferase family 2 protein n=1 Tax=Fusobacterium ulcerans TaxID=861 RepID=UPI0010329E9A|nr:glycosyltransferase family 2 protein [Fusobacterium ulcerans]